MKILITGHKGFIGSGLWDRLSWDYELEGIDLKEGKDILTADLPEVDLVIHLAGIGGVRESLADPKKYWENNVEGTRRILEHYQNTRVLVAGSSSQYEPHLNPYAASKHLIESIPHPNVVFMRFHTVYNEEARTGMFFDKLFKGTLEYVTDHERDFIHRDDLLDAIEIIINRDNLYSAFDLGTGKTICIKDIVPSLPVRSGSVGERAITKAKTKYFEEATGWKAKIDVRDFLQKNDERIRNLYPVK